MAIRESIYMRRMTHAELSFKMKNLAVKEQHLQVKVMNGICNDTSPE
jgi:hypothetical protein